jgi:hypothetical protein
LETLKTANEPKVEFEIIVRTKDVEKNRGVYKELIDQIPSVLDL